MGIKFQTDQSGANNNVCSTTSQIFNFSLARSNTLEVADFVIKKGSSTTASIVVAVYDQPNGLGNIVESVTVLASNITQTFATIVFTFAGSTTLSAGTSYSLKVSSTTSCSGSSPYSIKAGNFQVIDTTTNNIINTGYGIGADIFNVSSITSVADAKYNSLSTISTNNTVSGSALLSNSISASVSNQVTVSAQGTKITNNNNNRKIKLDGNNIPVKIYLGSQKRRVYHGNRMIIDKS